MDDMDFEMVASSLRADTADLSVFMEVLANKLEDALPHQTQVERKGAGLFSKVKRVQRVTVDMDGMKYDIRNINGRVTAARSKAVRGIVLKNEEIPLDAWIEALSRDLAQQAQSSEQARVALERLLGA